MKIYSWNMLYRNHELDRAFEFVSKSDFDIFCLQEVPDKFLARLKTLSCHLVETIDTECGIDTTVPIHLVILSRYPITNSRALAWPNYWHLLPTRTKLFVRIMRPFHWSEARNRTSLYADINTPGISLRVFNLHLLLASPEIRIREFETAMTKRDPSCPTVVCGDFNIIEKPNVSVLNWLLGGRVTDMLLYGRERLTIEKRFVEHELHNPLRGYVTHQLSRSQLDHILVSRVFSIQNAEVLPGRIGSDHHPIHVEIE